MAQRRVIEKVVAQEVLPRRCGIREPAARDSSALQAREMRYGDSLYRSAWRAVRLRVAPERLRAMRGV